MTEGEVEEVGATAWLDRVRIVLVGTTHPGNIGAAARAMKTMGFGSLYLVNPARFPSAEATARASGPARTWSPAQGTSSSAARSRAFCSGSARGSTACAKTRSSVPCA